jgi:methyl-accepting chemotaxis protein
MFAVTGDAAAMSTKNNKTGDQVFLITVIAIGVVLVLSVLSGVIISRSISRPVKKLTQSITRLASGETDIDLDEKATKDEIGRMCEATRTITNAIITLEQDTGMLIDAATEGQLTVRADAQVHRGIYRKIVEGINATMDAMIAPITESTDVLKELAKGNLNAEVSGEFKGDFALIKMALNETIETLKGYIQGITYMLGEMSEGVLTVKIESDYAGDFSVIKSAFNKSIESFNSVLSEINVAAEEVSSGTEQVSGSSQTISAGASEQSSALEQLSSSIAQIAEQTKSNADRAKKANQLSLQVKDNAIGGSEKMETLLGAMEEINDASASIFKIIKVIDDIAFQTNILALNAAIEAARAGVHGKGFAVVAEEVRNLAAKSAQAAKETTDLIDGSIRKTKVGTEIANVTAGALKEMVQSINTTVSLSEEIASSSGEQAVGINQINKGIMQLSDVVQSNSATAQEMAASSEELSGQAAMLKDMVGRFSLDEDNRNNLLDKPADIKLIDM